MSFKKIHPHTLILAAITVLTLIMGVFIWLVPPALFPDPSWGFRVMRSMQAGGGFNLIIGPDPLDISKNIGTFLSWWSPGQYLMPYFFKILFGVNTGHAVVLTIIGGNACGLTGFYYFFKKAGFSPVIAALSLVFIVIQKAFWIPYAYYNGGEILIFAFEGWFLYGCITLKKPGIKLIAFVLLSGWVGFFCKSSFMWVYVSGLLCLWIRLSAGQINLWGWIKKGLWLGVPAIVSIAIIYFTYLSKGDNPSASSLGFKLSFEAFGFPLASPLLAGFSVDDLLNGLIDNISGQPFTHTQVILILVLLAVLSILLIVILIRYLPRNDYRLFIIVFYGMAILFFGYSFLEQATISYEARHLRIIGLLIVPGLIYLISSSKLSYKVILGMVGAFIAYKSCQYVIAAPSTNKRAAHGNSGVALQSIDQPSLNYLLKLDLQQTNALFVFISVDVSLEIQHNRITTIEPYDAEIAEDDRVFYQGHAGPVYMLLPASYTGKKLALMFKYFPGYQNFTTTPLSKNYVLYTAK